jgi:hypothetical protein
VAYGYLYSGDRSKKDEITVKARRTKVRCRVVAWRSHDELTTLASGPWAKGEYKDCTSLNFKERKVLMTCDGVFGVEGKVFEVRFYGLTRFENKPELFQSNWQCRKNGDADPAGTCEIRK